MINSNLNLIRKQVSKFTADIDVNSRMARDEMASTLEQLAKEEIKGARPYSVGPQGGRHYEKATAGQPPMNRTGNLRRSIKAEKYRFGFANYSALVGPTLIYGRSVEVGGVYAPRSWRGTTAMQGFPYMSPAFRKFQEVAPSIIRKHLGRG